MTEPTPTIEAPIEAPIVDIDTPDTDIPDTDIPDIQAVVCDELFLKVAAIAGWTDIEKWNPSSTGKTYIGDFPDESKGKFIPRYDQSIDAIWELFESMKLSPALVKCQGLGYEGIDCYNAACNLSSESGDHPAIALCKVLVAVTESLVS